MTDWQPFFPPHTSVLALPTWERPRLYIPATGPFERWNKSAFYPAFRLRAKLFRIALRIGAATAMPIRPRRVQAHDWPLWDFLQDASPQTTSTSVLVGTDGPAQKITVQLCNDQSEVIGYLKYAEKPCARKRLQHEHIILSHLPRGLGPTIIKYGPWEKGEALLVTPLPGRTLPASLPPPEALIGYCNKLHTTSPVEMDLHPWAQRWSSYERVQEWLAILSDRAWPVAVQHGDLVSWNIRQQSHAMPQALDWEYGTLEGFPYLDLAYYILQLSALVYRWSPEKALTYATNYLTKVSALSLNRRQADALVRLSAFDAFHKSLEDSNNAESPLQQWRRFVWEELP